MTSSTSRVAIVHDYFTQRGGAERVAEHMAALFPAAPVFTSVLDPAVVPRSIDARRFVTSGLQRAFVAGVPLKALGPFAARAFGHLDLDQHDVIISSSSAFGHHVRAGRGAVHVCYCHTPPAFLYRREYFGRRSVSRVAASPLLSWMRHRDRSAATRVDRYVANSRFTAARIRDTYGIDAEVLYPAIDTAAFCPTTETSERFLVVSRLRPHKSIDVAVMAANLHHLPLDVIGEGSDRRRLEAMAGPTVRFLGWRSDADVAAAMARCVALVVPGVEDFGMVTAEVQAAGRPPIGVARGGTAEIVDEGVTGYLVAAPTVAAFGAAMMRAQREQLDPATLVESARRFDVHVFDASLRRVVDEVSADPRTVGPLAAGVGQ
ncbi:MAG TPA: glycosyltransferase [Ilumatobacteraceae bacterium]